MSTHVENQLTQSWDTLHTLNTEKDEKIFFTKIIAFNKFQYLKLFAKSYW